MADKYIKLVSGVPTETEATVQTAGAADAGKILALDANGKLDTTTLPAGIGADTALLTASENLAAGDVINVYEDTGAFKVRKADASTAGKHADGFVLNGVTAGNPATVYFEGTIVGLSGVTPGQLFLSATTPGGFSATPPSGAGKISQIIGIGVSSTSINFDRNTAYVLA